MNVLPVTYFSQILPGGLAHNNDCGAASALMVLSAYDLSAGLTVDQVYDKIDPSGEAPLSASGIQTVLSSYKISNKWMVDIQVHDLLDILIDQRLAIALIHYAPLVNAHITQITSFLGAHFVVVVGIDIKSICINDPLSTGSGAGLEVPIDVFKQAWSQCSLDNNPINGAIVTTIPIQDLSTSDTPTNGVEYEIGLWGGKQILGINVRSGPSSTYSLVNTIWQAETPDIYITQISGDWGQLADGSGWVYMPYLVKAGS